MTPQLPLAKEEKLENTLPPHDLENTLPPHDQKPIPKMKIYQVLYILMKYFILYISKLFDMWYFII